MGPGKLSQHGKIGGHPGQHGMLYLIASNQTTATTATVEHSRKSGLVNTIF